MSTTQIQRATAFVQTVWHEGEDKYESQGTAFLISDRYLLTAYHTVISAQQITVTFINSQPDEYDKRDARMVKFDSSADVAILELNTPVTSSIVPLPLSTLPLSRGDKWQTYGFPSTRLLTGQTIHGTTLQFNNLPNQSWTLGTHDIFPTTVLKGISGAACVHDGFVYGILRRREEQHLCLVSVENFKSLLSELNIETYANPLDAVDKAIKDAIIIKQPPPFENSEYVEREEFDTLFNDLKSQPFVLLSGDSFCGKSTLAKRIMVEYWSIGYRYLITQDPYEARRFLNEDAFSICLLDDPYGYENNSNWRIVNELCQESKANNKLLITSKLDVLLIAAGNSDLSRCRIRGIGWHNLTIKDRNLLLSIWDKVQLNAALDHDVVSKVREHLEHGQGELLQPGHLVQLAYEGNENIVGKSFSELRHIAMADAHELGVSFRNKGDEYWSIATCLALTCNTIKEVNEDDLAYMINQTSTPDASFGKVEQFRIQSFFFSKSKEEDPDTIPEYNSQEPIDANSLAALHFFEDRRYIVTTGQSRKFSHPQYLEAAAHSIRVNPRHDQKAQLIAYSKYAISCLNAESAYRCAEKLPYIYASLDEKELKSELIDIAVNALSRSIFFKVRAKSLVFLLSIFRELKEEVRDKVEYQIMNDNLNVSEIFWNKGVPFISEKYSITFDRPSIDSSEQPILIQKITEGEIISDELIWKLLFMEDDVPISVIKQALNSNEAFIRAQSAVVFFSQYHEFNVAEREIVALQIFDDEYPSVVAEAVKAIFEFSLKSAERDELEFFKILIRKSFSSQFVVLRLRVFLMTFGIDYGSESIDWENFSEVELTTTWLVWGDIFADFMAACQTQDVNFTSGRYSETLRLATKYISPSQGLLISTSIWDWIERTMVLRQLDTHELTCVDFMLATTSPISSERIALFRRIFNTSDTGLMAYNLQYALYGWSKLLTEEQLIIAELLQGDRKDKRWLKAAVATHEGEIPADLQIAMYGQPQFLNQEISNIVQEYPSDFLIDCLRMYCAIPDFPFWHYGLQGGGRGLWHSIVKHVLTSQSSGFELCISHFLHHVVNCPGREWGDWKVVWQSACELYHDKEFLLNSLIIHTGGSSVCIKPTATLWSIIHAAYQASGGVSQFGKVIAEKINILENTGHPEDLLRIIEPEVWYDDICPYFPSDMLVITLLTTIESLNISDDLIDTWRQTVNTLAEQLKSNPCKLYFTSVYSKAIAKMINEKMINKPKLELEKLQFHYDISTRPGRDALVEIKDKEVGLITDWVFATQSLVAYNL